MFSNADGSSNSSSSSPLPGGQEFLAVTADRLPSGATSRSFTFPTNLPALLGRRFLSAPRDSRLRRGHPITVPTSSSRPAAHAQLADGADVWTYPAMPPTAARRSTERRPGTNSPQISLARPAPLTAEPARDFNSRGMVALPEARIGLGMNFVPQGTIHSSRVSPTEPTAAGCGCDVGCPAIRRQQVRGDDLPDHGAASTRFRSIRPSSPYRGRQRHAHLHRLDNGTFEYNVTAFSSPRRSPADLRVARFRRTIPPLHDPAASCSSSSTRSGLLAGSSGCRSASEGLARAIPQANTAQRPRRSGARHRLSAASSGELCSPFVRKAGLLLWPTRKPPRPCGHLDATRTCQHLDHVLPSTAAPLLASRGVTPADSRNGESGRR